MNINYLNEKKIAFLLESLKLGGIGRLTLLLAEELADRGYQVDLVLLKKQGQYLKQVPSNVRIVDLKAKKLLLSSHLIGSYLKRENAAVLISANERVNIMALLAKKLFRVKTKLIISVHVNNSEAIARQEASIYKKLVILVARRIYRWADKVVAVSKGVAEDLEKLFLVSRDKIDVIYNPVISKDIGKKANEAVDHPWLNQDRLPVILGVGRLIRQKDFSTLVKSFYEIKKEIADAKLIILGEGEERLKLEREINELELNDDVDLPGYVENPYSYMKKSEVFVLSSAWEGFGNVLVEAMAVGTPVVSTECPSGPTEILEGGKYGPLVAVGDAGSLAAAAINILKDPPESSFLIRRAQDFSVDKAVNKYLEILKDFQEGKT